MHFSTTTTSVFVAVALSVASLASAGPVIAKPEPAVIAPAKPQSGAPIKPLESMPKAPEPKYQEVANTYNGNPAQTFDSIFANQASKSQAFGNQKREIYYVLV